LPPIPSIVVHGRFGRKVTVKNDFNPLKPVGSRGSVMKATGWLKEF